MVDGKRGEMTLSTIIAIVLGITVLVFLIFGFSSGWGNLWDKIMGETTESNVELRIRDCDNDCTAGEKSSWCHEVKELKFFDEGGKIVKIEGTCLAFFNNKVNNKLGFKDCSSFDCTA
jgi:hypothetical protein